MSKIQGLKKNVVKATIEGMDFVRVTNLNPNSELINVVMYIKVNGKYKVVLPNELPHQIVNKLSIDSTYTKMTEEEILEFLDSLKEIKEKITAQNEFAQLQYLSVGNVIDINYLLTKETNANYYALFSLIVNEFGVIKDNLPVTPIELPYVIMDILNEDGNFKSKTFLVHQNFFAHVYKDEDKYLTAIFEFKPSDKEEENPSVQVRGLFTIVEIDGKYTVVFDTENKLFADINEDKFTKVLDSFLQVLGLQKIDE